MARSGARDAPERRRANRVVKAKAAADLRALGAVRVVTLDISGQTITASVHGQGPCAVILGPGAGGTRATPQLLSVVSVVDPARYTTILFNFPYQEARRKFPDAAAILEATVAAVAKYARGTLGATSVILGGRSMGGRMASQAVAKGLLCDGLVFLAYPLHPPGDVQKLRDAHLGSIGVPMLFLQGTRDDFARLDLLQTVVGRLGPLAQLLLFDAADHSFKTPRGATLNSRQTEAAVLASLRDWLDRTTG